jgi:predicted permease
MRADTSARIRIVKRVLRRLSHLAPRWRRDDWLREWSAEVDAAGVARTLSLTFGAAAHVLWLWRHEWSIDMVGADWRHAIRTLLGQPAFTLTVVVTLALGIGATTAMFTIVDAVLLRALPYPHADRLVVIWPRVTLSPHLLEDAERPRTPFETIGAYSGWGFTLTGGEQAEAVQGARITPHLLALLGVHPIRGHGFDADSVRPGQDHVALIGEGLWRRRFAGHAEAVGGHLAIEGVDYTILGIMPASFEFPDNRSELWTPLTIDPAGGDYNANFASLLGRLSPGTTLASAQDRMRAYADELYRDAPKQFGSRFFERAIVTPLQGDLVRDVRKPLLLLLVAVGVLLVIACANSAHLLLARSASRDVELAVRAALGATRLRLVRQLLAESLVLAGIGGLAGVMLAFWLVGAFVPLVPELPEISRAAVIDGRVLAFTVLVVVGSAMLFGLAPALQSSRSDAQCLLAIGRSGSRSPGRASLGRLLVWAEVVLATMLVASAALLARSFLQLTRVDLGFRPASVLTLHASAPESLYPEDDQVRRVFHDVLQQVRATPGVQSVGAIHLLPLTPDNWNPGVRVEGVPAADQYPLDVNWRVVTPEYFRVMHIPTRAGRAFDDTDDQRALLVAIVNDAFVRTVFRGQEAIGRRIRTAFEGKNTWATVVGVVGDVRQHAVDQPALPEIYRPFAQHPLSSMRLMVTVVGDPSAVAPAVRAAVLRVDKDIAVDEVQPLTAVVDHALGGARLPFLLAMSLSLTAMLLGVVGVAGIQSFDIARQQSEIGLRLALGAPPTYIRRLFFVKGLRLGVAGVGAGAVVAMAVTGLLRSLLFGVSPADPATLAAVCVIFVAVIAIAAYIPARRAARVDPIDTLRAR